MRSMFTTNACCLAAALLLLLSPFVHGWTSSRHQSWRGVSFTRTTTTKLSLSSTQRAEDDPCWQDLYDDDCSMSSAYSANFVAGKWVKSMPCANALDEVRSHKKYFFPCHGKINYSFFISVCVLTHRHFDCILNLTW